MRKRIIRVFITGMVAVIFCCGNIAYADGDITAASVTNGLVDIFYSLRVIGLAAAIVSIAVNAVMLIAGNPQQADAAKKGIIYTCIAVACMFLIPAAIQFGTDLGKGGSVYFDPAFPEIAIDG